MSFVPIKDYNRPRFLTLDAAEKFMDAFDKNRMALPSDFGAIMAPDPRWHDANYELQVVVQIGKPNHAPRHD